MSYFVEANVFEHAADVWRVPLKGESNDYIHASFAHVRAA